MSFQYIYIQVTQNYPLLIIDYHHCRLINDQIFQWKSLRLLARRSPHFFTHTNTPAVPQPQYLEMMLNRLAKEIHPTTGSQSIQENQVEVKTDIGDEEEAIKESQEDNDLRQSGDQGNVGVCVCVDIISIQFLNSRYEYNYCGSKQTYRSLCLSVSSLSIFM